MTRRARAGLLAAALTLPTLLLAAPGAPSTDARVHAFLSLHPEARAAFAAGLVESAAGVFDPQPVTAHGPRAAGLAPTVAADNVGHRKVCRSAHPPASAAGPVLASMRAMVAEAATLDEDWQVFFAFYQHARAMLEAEDPIPAGLCAALRGGLDGANETSSYASAASVIRETYVTLLELPHLFLGAPRVAMLRGLQLHRDAVRHLEPADDRRRALKFSLNSYARCPELVGNRPLAWALFGLGSASIIPDFDDSARVLMAASEAVATLGDDPLATAHTLGLEAIRAARTMKAKFWFPYVLIDHLVQTGDLDDEHEEALRTARKKAFEALEDEDGVAVMARILAEFAAPGRGRGTVLP